MSAFDLPFHLGEVPPTRHFSTITYPGFGRSMYCDAKDGRLSDEHIIPYSLAGVLIIKEASCSACAKITCKIEGAVAQSLFGTFRMRHKLPSRCPKERPMSIPLEIVGERKPNTPLNIPVGEFPAPACLYKCTRAS
jgi:hypothetical protein